MRAVTARPICAIAAVAAFSCGVDDGGADPDDRAQALAAARTPDQRRLVDQLHDVIGAADRVRSDPRIPRAHRAAVARAADDARAALAHVIALSRQGDTRAVLLGRITRAGGAVVADNVTGIGAADDWLLVVCGVAAVAAVLTTQARASAGEVARAWSDLSARLQALDRATQDAAADLTAGPASCPDGDPAPAEPEPADQSTVELSPESGPAYERATPDRDRDRDRDRRTCETAFPRALECWRLPDSYTYPNVGAALRQMKAATGNHRLKRQNDAPAETGPCPGEGTHHNVRDSARRVGSIACCPCCADNPGGPVKEERCRIVW